MNNGVVYLLPKTTMAVAVHNKEISLLVAKDFILQAICQEII